MMVEGSPTVSLLELVSDEVLVASAVFIRTNSQELECEVQEIHTPEQLLSYRNRRTGVAFSRLVDILRGIVSARRISSSLDVLLDDGILSPQNGPISDGEDDDVWDGRLYLPGEIVKDILDGLAEIILDERDRTEVVAKRQVVRKGHFQACDMRDLAALKKDRAVIGYVLRSVQDTLSARKGLRHVLLLKMLANMFKHDLSRIVSIFKSSIEVRPYCYGPVPYIRRSSIVLGSAIVTKVRGFPEWSVLGSGPAERVVSGFNTMADAIQEMKRLELTLVAFAVDALVAEYVKIAEKSSQEILSRQTAVHTEQLKKLEEKLDKNQILLADILNSLCTARTCDFCLDCLEFEKTNMGRWWDVCQVALSTYFGNSPVTMDHVKDLLKKAFHPNIFFYSPAIRTGVLNSDTVEYDDFIRVRKDIDKAQQQGSLKLEILYDFVRRITHIALEQAAIAVRAITQKARDHFTLAKLKGEVITKLAHQTPNPAIDTIDSTIKIYRDSPDQSEYRQGLLRIQDTAGKLRKLLLKIPTYVDGCTPSVLDTVPAPLLGSEIAVIEESLVGKEREALQEFLSIWVGSSIVRIENDIHALRSLSPK